MCSDAGVVDVQTVFFSSYSDCTETILKQSHNHGDDDDGISYHLILADLLYFKLLSNMVATGLRVSIELNI